MSDNITILDSAEVEKTVATKELAGEVHVSKQLMVDPDGNPFGYSDDDIAMPVQVVEDIFHYAVHEGISFGTSTYHATADQYICFTTPNTTSLLHFLWHISAEHNTRLNVWEGVTAGAVDGDQVVYNKNRATSMNGRGDSGVLAGNSATAGSVQVGQAFTGGVQINPQGFFVAKGGGAIEASHEFVLEKNTTYGFHLDNIESKDAGMTFTWFEVPVA